jgi:histidine ammonia-lyase
MNTELVIGEEIHLNQLIEIVKNQASISLSEQAKVRVESCFQYLQNKINNTNELIYGVNTGFGAFCNTSISNEDLHHLQYNLLRSHACGTGELVPTHIVKLMLLLKAQSLSYGHSGVQLQTIQRIIDFYNLSIIPVVYQQGSLGASGDLAPLAHLCLPLIGEGYVWHEGKIVESTIVLNKYNLEPLTLTAKEGLALINGTQFMSAYGLQMVMDSERIFEQLNFVAALSFEAFDCRIEPFLPQVHQIRKQSGQSFIANQIKSIVEESEIVSKVKTQVQDPYSFRCIPQVHGASWDAMNYVKQVIMNEINSVTDNPNVFVEDNLVISGGNFHGQPLAITLDFAAIAMAELANISERRIYKLVGGERGLPMFLTTNGGLESGLMIAQYTAASIVSQNKQWCTPASVDSIVSSNGQEDHVSMGSNAATKLYKVIENVKQVIAIEAFTAMMAFEYRRPLKTSIALEQFIVNYQSNIELPKGDVFLSPYLLKSKTFLFE